MKDRIVCFLVWLYEYHEWCMRWHRDPSIRGKGVMYKPEDSEVKP